MKERALVKKPRHCLPSNHQMEADLALGERCLDKPDTDPAGAKKLSRWVSCDWTGR